MRTITAMALGFLLVLGAAGSFAEEGGHEGHESQSSAHQSMGAPPVGMGHQMGHKGTEMHGSSTQHGMGMHEQMQALHDHSKMMEEITDQKKLVEEMKEHMRMMDEMMQQMMQSDMAAVPTEAPSETP
jgi:hypothetical protein